MTPLFVLCWGQTKPTSLEARMGARTLLYGFNIYHCCHEAEVEVNLLAHHSSFKSHYLFSDNGDGMSSHHRQRMEV